MSLRSLFPSPKPSDWYGVSRQELMRLGGRGLFQYFPSLAEALKAVYPDVPWQPSKFVINGKTPHGFWSNVANQRGFFEEIAQDLGLEEVK